jgi:HEPN domain-containing protein
MKQPEEIKREFTRQWIEKAESDYGTSNHLFSEKSIYLEAVTFHAQQAAEKYFKALLVWHQTEFPKTHDMHLLLELLSSLQPGLSQSLADVVTLTPYGVEYRYPGDYPEVTWKDAEKALEIAGRVREAILQILPGDILEKDAHGPLV